VTVGLLAALSVIVFLSPGLLAARSLPGVDTTPMVSGIPVGWHGLYFFTILALSIAIVAARLRAAGALGSVILAVAGLGFFEFIYGVAFAATTGRTGLLLLSPGLPATGWAGLGTWVLVELLFASFALVSWDRAGADRLVAVTAALFILGLAIWDLLLDWNYPPFDNSPAVYLVNTLTEVSGTSLLPLIFTARPVKTPDFVHRTIVRWLSRLARTTTG
jgi:hypothetical protein